MKRIIVTFFLSAHFISPFSIISSFNMNVVLTSIYFAFNHVFLIQSDAEFVFIGYAMPSASRSNAREFAKLGSHSV